MVNTNALQYKRGIILLLLILIITGCAQTQSGKASTTQKKNAEYGFPWKFSDLDEKEQKKAIKLGYKNSDMVYRNAPIGKIIPAANQPKVIIKKMTVMNNEVVYYGIVNLKVVHKVDEEKIRKLGYEVPKVWVEIKSKGKQVKYIAPSEVPKF